MLETIVVTGLLRITPPGTGGVGAGRSGTDAAAAAAAVLEDGRCPTLQHTHIPFSPSNYLHSYLPSMHQN